MGLMMKYFNLCEKLVGADKVERKPGVGGLAPKAWIDSRGMDEATDAVVEYSGKYVAARNATDNLYDCLRAKRTMFSERKLQRAIEDFCVLRRDFNNCIRDWYNKCGFGYYDYLVYRDCVEYSKSYDSVVSWMEWESMGINISELLLPQECYLTR